MPNKDTLVTFALFAYNHEKYIRAAVEGALSQDYPNLEIILSDDCSSDDTLKIIQEAASAYTGSHRVVINRNPQNLGLVPHFNKVIVQSKGEIIVTAGGDDISLPDRVSKTVELFNSDPKATFISLGYDCINADGTILNMAGSENSVAHRATLEPTLTKGGPPFHGAINAYNRIIFEVFGEIMPTCPVEDEPCVLRGLILGLGLSSTEKAVHYRLHGNNLSSSFIKREKDIEGLRNQHYADLKVAMEQNLLDGHQYQIVKQWIEKWHHHHLLMFKFRMSRSKSFFFLTSILPSKHISKGYCWSLCKGALYNKSRRFFNKQKSFWKVNG